MKERKNGRELMKKERRKAIKRGNERNCIFMGHMITTATEGGSDLMTVSLIQVNTHFLP